MDEDQVSEEQLLEGEEAPADHDHEAVEPTAESVWDHLAYEHAVAVPDGLSLSTLQGMHDRFHGEAHAADE